MKKKFKKLSAWSFALAFVIFAFSYILYHYAAPAGGFSLTFRTEPAKPLITQLFAVLGVMFLFSGIISILISKIFFNDNK